MNACKKRRRGTLIPNYDKPLQHPGDAERSLVPCQREKLRTENPRDARGRKSSKDAGAGGNGIPAGHMDGIASPPSQRRDSSVVTQKDEQGEGVCRRHF